VVVTAILCPILTAAVAKRVVSTRVGGNRETVQ
jgi:hypothetical protein